MKPVQLFRAEELELHTPVAPAVAEITHDFDTSDVLALTAPEAGIRFNGVQLVIGAAVESQDFAISRNTSGNGKILTITPACDAGTKAAADIGAGANGTVTIEYQTAGAAGNDLEVAVVVAEANDAALSAAFASGVLTVTLGTDSNGDPDDAKNTATLVAAVITALPAFNATASGTGATAVGALEGTEPFVGGGADVLITTTIADVITALEDYADLVVATLDSGSDTTVVEPVTLTLVGGANGTPLQQGQACYDEDFLYLAVGNATVTDSSNIKKIALASL